MQQIYRRTPMRKCDFNKVPEQLYLITLRHGYSPVNLLYIFRTCFPRNTSGWLLLNVHTRFRQHSNRVNKLDECMRNLYVRIREHITILSFTKMKFKTEKSSVPNHLLFLK